MTDDDIRDAMDAEKRRGRSRRPIDRRKVRDLRSSIQKYLRLGTEEEFIEEMAKLGLSAAQLNAAVEAWREFRDD
jgi:crotonobetainyl-CoA:carnitine CoA-transferase CaiB-like acyl-CoA transferase